MEGAVFDGDHPATAATELKYLVREMHRAGIEVLLEINPSTVADASDDTSTGAISLRGIDSALYFRDGTTLDCSHPIVQVSAQW